MKKVLFVGILVSLVAACGSSSNEANASEKSTKSDKIAEKELTAVIPNRKLTLEIDGMVCEMGCGGSIRKELTATGAVSRCSFDFKGENVSSSATIEFDKDKITADQIAALIKKLNDGQFSVGKMTTETITAEINESLEGNETKSSEKEVVPVHVSSSSGIQLPNFIELLSELLIH